MQRALATGEPWELDVDIIGPDGAVRRVHASGAAVRDESGRVVRLNGTLQDITDQKRAEEALRQRRKRSGKPIASFISSPEICCAHRITRGGESRGNCTIARRNSWLP